MAELDSTRYAAQKLSDYLPDGKRSLSDESYYFLYFQTDDLAVVQQTLHYTMESLKCWKWREDTVTINQFIQELGLEDGNIQSLTDEQFLNRVNFPYFDGYKAPLVVYVGNTPIKAGSVQEQVLNRYVSFCASTHQRQLDAQEDGIPCYAEDDGFQLYNNLFFIFYGRSCNVPEHLSTWTVTIAYPSLSKSDVHHLLVEYSIRAKGIRDAKEAQEAQKKLDAALRSVDTWYTNRMAGLEEGEVRRILSIMNSAACTSSADYARKDLAEKVIIEYKNRRILQHNRLKLIETERKKDSAEKKEPEVVGLGNVIKWLETHKKVIGDYEDSPTGILLVGIPGTGKSATAKEAARMLDMPLVQLDMSKILGGRVGDSEKGMREMLEDLKFVAPCVLWIDEIEKAMSGADGKSGDGGVVQRLFGMLLTFIQENKRPVFTVTTANDISKLPPEFFRNGRFDQTFCLMMPSYAECCKIMQLKLSKYFKKLGWEEKCDDELAEKLLIPCLGTAAAPRFLTGADIDAHAKEFYWSCKKYTKRPSDDELVEEMGKVAKTVRAQATPAAAHTMEDIAKRYVFMMRRGMTMAGEGSIYTPDRLDLDKVLYYSFEEDTERKGLPLCMKEPEGYKENCTGKSPKEWYDVRFFYELTKAMSKVVATDKELAFDETLREYIKLQRHLLKNSPQPTE